MLDRRFRLMSTGRRTAEPPRPLEEGRVALHLRRPRPRWLVEEPPTLLPGTWFAETDLQVIPGLLETAALPDPIAWVKLFTSWIDCRWYVMEFDGAGLFFGVFSGLEAEIGYFSLADLSRVRSFWGEKVERDMNFEPTPLSLLRRGVR